MPKKRDPRTLRQVLLENEDLRARLERAEETLRAIRNAEVDALVVSSEQGDQVFSLKSADYAYRVIIEQMNEGAISLSADGLILYCNRRFAEMVNTPIEHVIGSMFHEFVASTDQPLIDAILQEGCAVGRQVEIACRSSDGTMTPVLLSFPAVPTDAIGHLCAVVTNLTERKQAEELSRQAHDRLEDRVAERTAELAAANQALTAEIAERRRVEEELKFRNVLLFTQQETSIDGILVVDENGAILSSNRRFADMWGISPGIMGTHSDNLALQSVLDKLVEPEIFLQRVNYLYQHHNETSREEILLKDGRTFDRYSAPMCGVGGKYYGRVWDFRDVTERKLAEEALKKERNLLRTLIDNMPDCIYVKDLESRFVINNTAHLHLLGATTQEEVLGKTDFDIFPDELAAGYYGDEQEVIRTNRPLLNKEEVTTDTQRHRQWILTTKVPMCDIEGNVRGIVGISRDITERKRREDERARLVMAIEHAAEAVVVTDAEGTIEYVNPAFEQITGYTRGEAVGKNPRILKSGKQDDAFYKDLWHTITRGEVWSGRFTNMKKDGNLYEEEATISPVMDTAGKIVSFVAIKRDISARLVLERRLRLAEKMEAIGTLAGGIAHDFNNVLAAIIGYSEIAASELAPESPVRRDLEQVLCAADRAKSLVRQILTFSRQVEEERRPVELGLIVNEALKLLRPSLPTTIEILTRIEKDCGLILADATQAHQVIVNLCTNAYHAMRETGGVLTVSVEPFQVDWLLAQSNPGLHKGPYVRLSVSDTGCGMTKETQERVFEPFFTTKAPGEGTGLGLATAHGIVSAHGGVVTIYSEVGKGTTFHVYLPCAELAAPEPSLSEERVPGGHERILVLDDEEPLARLMERTLRNLGYDVVTMTSSVDALAAFRAQPQLFDLIVTDQTMPKITGERLAGEVWRIRPDMRVILTTGAPGGMLSERLAEIGVAAILTKPASVSETARVVRQILDGR